MGVPAAVAAAPVITLEAAEMQAPGSAAVEPVDIKGEARENPMISSIAVAATMMEFVVAQMVVVVVKVPAVIATMATAAGMMAAVVTGEVAAVAHHRRAAGTT